MALATEETLAKLAAGAPKGAVVSSPDQAITGGVAVALTALAAGPNGILVTAHPNNTNVIRVSGSDVAVGQGQPLGAGASVAFNVANANLLSAIVESGSGKLCVSAQ